MSEPGKIIEIVSQRRRVRVDETWVESEHVRGVYIDVIDADDNLNSISLTVHEAQSVAVYLLAWCRRTFETMLAENQAQTRLLQSNNE